MNKFNWKIESDRIVKIINTLAEQSGLGLTWYIDQDTSFIKDFGGCLDIPRREEIKAGIYYCLWDTELTCGCFFPRECDIKILTEDTPIRCWLIQPAEDKE